MEVMVGVGGGGGVTTGPPLQVHVSPRKFPFASLPPNDTACACPASNAMPSRFRTGGLLAGVAWVQLEPSQSQVALKRGPFAGTGFAVKTFEVPPPKRTT